MYCPFCRTEINNQSKFCGACGKAQISTNIVATSIWPKFFCYIIGALFIIGGILPYLLQGDLEEYNAYISSLYVQSTLPAEISAISCFRQFSSFLSPLFYFSSSIITI